MKLEIEGLEGAVRTFLHTHGRLVEAKRLTSKREHLEVWSIGSKRRAAGFELDHSSVLNIWVTAQNRPSDLSAEAVVMRKTPVGRFWTDENGKGANSNLSAYDEFRGKIILRLGVNSIADAMIALNHLNR